jgi:hypothetical protein
MGTTAPSIQILRLVAVLLSVSLGSCSGKIESGPAPLEAIPLEITNRHYLDITIYAIHDGQRTRLGVAGGSGHTKMVVPARLLGAGRELRLYGDPVGSSDRAISDVIVVQPGQYIEWLLEPGLDRSTISVY